MSQDKEVNSQRRGGDSADSQEFLGTDMAESVFLAGFPEVMEEYLDEGLEARWSRLIAIRDEANRALEVARKDKFIGNALEARLVFHVEEEEHGLLKSYEAFLPALFIVSDVEIRRSAGPAGGAYESAEIKGLRIGVERAQGKKCERCWNWSPSVGSFDDHPEVCGRCVGALR